MAALTRKQTTRYARLTADVARYTELGYTYLVEDAKAELALLDAVLARTTKQKNYRDSHDAHVVLWGKQIVTKHNLLSGKEFKEARNTPGYLSPASEAYWSA